MPVAWLVDCVDCKLSIESVVQKLKSRPAWPIGARRQELDIVPPHPYNRASSSLCMSVYSSFTYLQNHPPYVERPKGIANI